MRGPRGIPLIPFAPQGGRPGLGPPHDPARRPQEQARQFRLNFAGRWEPSIFRRFRLVPSSFSVSRIVSQTGRARSASFFLSKSRMEPPSPGLMVQSPRHWNCIAPASATNTLLPGRPARSFRPRTPRRSWSGRRANTRRRDRKGSGWSTPGVAASGFTDPTATAQCYSGDDADTDEELSPGFS